MERRSYRDRASRRSKQRRRDVPGHLLAIYDRHCRYLRRRVSLELSWRRIGARCVKSDAEPRELSKLGHLLTRWIIPSRRAESVMDAQRSAVWRSAGLVGSGTSPEQVDQLEQVSCLPISCIRPRGSCSDLPKLQRGRRTAPTTQWIFKTATTFEASCGEQAPNRSARQERKNADPGRDLKVE